MKELKEYRRTLIEKLGEAARAFRAACLAVKDPYAPLHENGWNVHQLAAHTRDVERLVYGLRAHRTAREDNPEFPSFDGDAHMTQSYDASEPLGKILDDLVDSVERLNGLLRDSPDEAWSRLSRHTTLGSSITLQRWVEKSLAHIREHLDTLQKHTGNAGEG